MIDATTKRPLIDTRTAKPTAPMDPSATRTMEASAEASRSFVWRALAALVGGMATLALSVLARRHLAPGDFAQFVVFLSGLFVGPLLARFGSGSRAVRELSGYIAEGATEPAGTSIRSTIVDTLPFTLIFSVLTTAWVVVGSNASASVYALVLVSLLAESLRLLLSDIMAALQRTGWAAALGHQLRTVASLAMYVSLVLLGHGRTPVAFFGSIAASSVLLLVIGAHATLRAAPAGTWRRPQNLGRSVRLGLPFVLVELCLFTIARGDVWLANRYLGVEAANYATASFLAMQLGIPAGLAGHAVSPSIARLWHLGDIAALRALLLRFQGRLAALLLPGAVVAAALAPVILRVFDDRSTETKTFFAILLIGNALAGSMMLSMNTLLMIGKAWQAAAAMTVGVAIYLPIAFVLASRGHFVAFAWTSTAASSLLLTSLAVLCVREFRVAMSKAAP